MTQFDIEKYSYSKEELKKSIKILSKMKSIIEKGWCQGKPALDENFRPTNIYGKEAKYFCLLGSYDRSLYKLNIKIENLICYKLQDILLTKYNYIGSLAKWNDDPKTKKEDVLNLVSEVIKEFKTLEAANV